MATNDPIAQREWVASHELGGPRAPSSLGLARNRRARAMNRLDWTLLLALSSSGAVVPLHRHGGEGDSSSDSGARARGARRRRRSASCWRRPGPDSHAADGLGRARRHGPSEQHHPVQPDLLGPDPDRAAGSRRSSTPRRRCSPSSSRTSSPTTRSSRRGKLAGV